MKKSKKLRFIDGEGNEIPVKRVTPKIDPKFLVKDGEKVDIIELDKIDYKIHEEPSKFSHDQLLQTLYWVFDFMDRAMINFYLVGSTAESVRNHKDLFGDKINVAVRKNEWISGARNIADAFAQPLKETETKVEYEFQGVPVTLNILEDNEMLTSADTVLYASEFFRLPNPYEKFVEEFSWLK